MRTNGARGRRRAISGAVSGLVLAALLVQAAAAGPLLGMTLNLGALNLGALFGPKPQPAPPPPPPTTTTTTTAPSTPPPTDGLRTDTGLTRVQVRIDSSAAWTNVTLDNTQILSGRVVSTSGRARVTSMGPLLAIMNTGSAVFELVLRIAPEAQPTITTCKSYFNSSTFTITRTTTGSTVVASVTNNSHSSGGTCENLRRFGIARSALMGSTRWPARVDPRPLVLANYYPWFDPDYADHDFGDNPTGPANTRDPAQVAQAVDRAWESGVDGFVVEYDNLADHASRVDSLYATAQQHGGFKLCLMLDFDILDQGGQMTAARFDQALNAVANRADHPSQLLVNGQPVVFLYGAPAIDPTLWQQALNRLRTNTGISPFVIAEDPPFLTPGHYRYVNNSAAGAEMNQWVTDRLFEYRVTHALNGGSGPLWVAPVSPGYDATREGRSTPFVARGTDGQRYIDSWHAAWSTLPDWILITSWNEYWEQTHVMPGHTSGDRALDQTAERSDHFHTTG